MVRRSEAMEPIPLGVQLVHTVLLSEILGVVIHNMVN